MTLIITVCAYGSTTFIWDHGGAEGYRLYLSEYGKTRAQVWQGPEKTTTLDLEENKQYWCTVTTYKGDLESEHSEVLVFTVSLPQKTIVIPGKPSSITIKFTP